ncbi:MAG TPA: 30S ribosomal protein S9 [Armatimonadota bacterium]|nr:30S ribosomal protein S9 [Armatimonadota bacterium]HOP79948.1 30S ribosomal protein S9 [Armatimonadota bacterium]HPP75299.1 30S ribosomal protein S9 [Armatimonadota bacterium]
MEETARYYATGHRKNATAKVWLTPGEGKIVINGRPMSEYLGRKTLEMLVLQPFEAVDAVGKYDVNATAIGGGISGQAGAVRHGIAKALLEAGADMRPTLRRLGYLTRDPRVKERKKYGRKRARRGFQFSKR